MSAARSRRRRYANAGAEPLALLPRREIERQAFAARDVQRIHAWEIARRVAEAFARALHTSIERVAPYIYSEYVDGPRPWGSARTERNPYAVVVTTEPPSPIRDPFDRAADKKAWERMERYVREDPLVEDVEFDSINPAIHVVVARPRLVA